jgi:hypothetical protein
MTLHSTSHEYEFIHIYEMCCVCLADSGMRNFPKNWVFWCRGNKTMCNKWTWGRTVTGDGGGKKSRMKAACCPSLGRSNIRDYDTTVMV